MQFSVNSLKEAISPFVPSFRLNTENQDTKENLLFLEKDMLTHGLITKIDSNEQRICNVPLLHKRLDDTIISWGEYSSVLDSSFTISILDILMPEMDWLSFLTGEKCQVMSIVSDRFHEDFISIIPENGGRIPYFVMTRWVDAMRLLILTSDLEKMMKEDI